MTNDLTGSIGVIRQDFHANSTERFTPFEGRGRRWRSREFSLFFQDTWKVRPNITLNLGLRWEIFPPVFEADGLFVQPLGGLDRLLGISGASGQPTRTGLAPDKGAGIYGTDWNNFAPNIGFTWDPTNRGKWSISANYRIAYDRVGNVMTGASNFFNEGMGATRTIFPRVRFSDAGRFLPLPTPEIFAPIPFDRLGVVYAIDSNLYVPHTQSWSLRIQHEVMRNTLLQVAYVGNKATGQYRAVNVPLGDG